MTTKFERMRKYVNSEIARRLKGKKVSKRERVKIFRQVWKEAKRKYK